MLLSSIIKNNIFSWHNWQNKCDLQNFNLFWIPVSFLKRRRNLKYFLCYFVVRRFSKTRITRELKKNTFWLIKNHDKITCDHLKLYFYYINKEQKLLVMYLQLIFTGIRIKKWKVAEVPEIVYVGMEVGRKYCKKDGSCWIWSRKNARAEI